MTSTCPNFTFLAKAPSNESPSAPQNPISTLFLQEIDSTNQEQRIKTLPLPWSLNEGNTGTINQCLPQQT